MYCLSDLSVPILEIFTVYTCNIQKNQFGVAVRAPDEREYIR